MGIRWAKEPIAMTETKDACQYFIGIIEREIEQENYIGIVRVAEHLSRLVRFAAINQEREMGLHGRGIIEIPPPD